MALIPIAPSAPNETYARINAAITAVNAVQNALAVLQQFAATEPGARDAAVAGEALARAVDISSVRTALQNGLNLEQTARVLADALEQTARIQADSVEEKIRAASYAALTNLIFDRITSGGLAAAVEPLQDALTAARQRIAALEASAASKGDIDALSGAVAIQSATFVPARHRPGDNPTAFTLMASPLALSGPALPMPAVPSGKIGSGSNGQIIRIVGSAVLAGRQATPVELGRVYRARIVVERRANPSDPANDAVQLGITCMGQNLTVLPGADGIKVLLDLHDLRSAAGRREYQFTFARSPGDNVNIVVPSGTRFIRPYARTFGSDGVTDIEVIQIEDVTQATVLPALSADVVSRVGALESQDPGVRLDALEQQVSAPNSLTFRTKGEAASAAIPAGVAQVRLLAGSAPNDGRGGSYARASSPPPAGADTFVSGGETWLRIRAAQDTFNADQAALQPGYLASLPTSPPPDGPGPWNNGGLPAFS